MIQEIISKFVADGTISSADAVRVSEQYGRLLERNGDPKTARLQLIEWLEQEAAHRRAAARQRPPEQRVNVPAAPYPASTALATALSAVGRGWVTCLASLAIGVAYYFALARSPARTEWFETAGAPAFVAGVFWLQAIIRMSVRSDTAVSPTRVLGLLLEKQLIAYAAFGLGVAVAFASQWSAGVR